MNKAIGSLLLVGFLSGSFCQGQAYQPPADSQPALSNVRDAEYPRVTSDLRAIF
jgi:hypothetical protein